MYTREDLDTFRVVHEQIVDFKKFILDRLQAYVNRPDSKHRHILDVHKKGWDYWIVSEDSLWNDEEFVICAHRLDDEREPTMTTETVAVPWAWVFGEIEADEDYQMYLKLKERFEK